MTKIKKLVDEMLEEVCSAKEYAEKYVEYKAKGESTWSNRFKEMANDELKHAEYLHELAIKNIETLSKVFTPPESMMSKWNEDHKVYVEKVAWIKMMLEM